MTVHFIAAFRNVPRLGAPEGAFARRAETLECTVMVVPLKSLVAVIFVTVGSAALARQMSARAQLDEAQRLCGELQYPAAVALFETVQAQQPDAVLPLDGLKIVTVYAQ